MQEYRKKQICKDFNKESYFQTTLLINIHINVKCYLFILSLSHKFYIKRAFYNIFNY